MWLRSWNQRIRRKNWSKIVMRWHRPSRRRSLRPPRSRQQHWAKQTRPLQQTRIARKIVPHRRPFPPRQLLKRLPPQRSKLDIEQYTVQLNVHPWHVFPSSEPKLEFPLSPIFAISMREYRFENLLQRMSHWAPLVQLFPATDGRKISVSKWRKLGRLKATLTPGQVGCYESHARLWQHIVASGVSRALILEDDADISYCSSTVQRLNEFLQELKQFDWDVAYIGNIGLHPWKRQLSAHVAEPSNWEGLYTYLITNHGAKKLLRHAFPMQSAVDIYVGHELRKGNVNVVAMTPPLNFVVPVVSDTDRKVLS